MSINNSLKKIEALSLGDTATGGLLAEINYTARKELARHAWWRSALRRLPEYLGVALATLILWWSAWDSIPEWQVGVPKEYGVPADLPAWAENELVNSRLRLTDLFCYESAYAHRLSMRDAYKTCTIEGGP
jgi:hypothetical protein